MYDVINMPDLVVRYFSSTPWLVVYIFSIVYLFIRLNMAKKRAMLIAAIVFFLFINAFVIKIFTKLDQNSTYYRHLWAIPSIVIVGIGVVDLVRIVPKWYLRIPMIIGLAIGLWFINGQEYIRCRIQIFSTDTKLVPEDVIELGDKLEELRQESGKNILFVVCPYGYERPYGNMVTELELYSGCIRVDDSSLLNGAEHNGEEELTGDNPDVEYIMSVCCENGIDYVIVTKAAETKFDIFGYEPCLQTENYLMYGCSGYAGYEQDFTEHGKTSWISWHNNLGERALNERGFSFVEYVYDNRDRTIVEQYRDQYGNLTNINSGYARITWEYSEKGLMETKFYNSEGNLSDRKDYGYCIVRYIRNEKGQVKEKKFLNAKEELVDFDYQNPRAITRYEYDINGNKISEKYYDSEDKASKALAGYDEIRWLYDGYGHIIREGYYCNGKLIKRSDLGYAEIIIDYNKEGKLEKTIYLDDNGNIVNQ